MKEFFSNLKFVWQYAKDQKAKLIKYILLSFLFVPLYYLLCVR